MKIRFLGTSHGVPMPGRFCQSILFETEEGLYLVDGGAPVSDLLIREGYDLTRLRAVFVTHQHSDHMLGLFHLLDLATWYFKEMRFTVYLPEESGPAFFRQVLGFLEGPLSDRIDYRVYTEGAVFSQGDFSVSAHPTRHIAPHPAFGFLVAEGERRVYVTGDMRGDLSDFPSEFLKAPLDLLIPECAHCSAEALFALCEETGAATVAPVHVYPTAKYDTLAALSEASSKKWVFPKDLDGMAL